MKKVISYSFCSLAAIAMLAACGGGGGGGGTPPPPPVAKSSTATVSGTAVISLSALVSKSAAKLDGAAIEIVSYDKSDKELGRAAVTTDEAGGFAAQVPLLDTGGYVMVIATKEGFSQYQKRVDYTTAGNIELKAILQSLNVAFANVSSGSSSAITAGVGKSSEKSFSFAVVKYPNGVKKALAGTSIRAAKAAGAASELEINIPASTVPGVKRLKGELETFDPAKESDRFPGSYTGVVGGKEGKMVSLAFDFVKISDADTGENLGKVAARLAKSGVKKAAESATTVTRSIYSSSCDNMFIEDYNLTAAGWQVPVWSLNPSTGKWVFIGEGTAVDNSGVIISSPTETGCGGGTYRLKIIVANTEFAKSWWNLDHIVFDTPKEVCLKGKFAYSNGDPLKDLYLTLSGSNIDYKWGKTDPTTGEYTLTTVLLNKGSSDRTGILSYQDETGSYTNVDVTLSDPPACGAYSKTNFAKPCEVSGKLIDGAGKGVPNRWLNLQGNNFYRGVNSDSNGAFSSLVACNTDIKLLMGGTTQLASFNVNGTTTANSDEATDDAAKVTLNNLTAPNIPPSGYAYLSQRSIKVGGAVTAQISAYDEDSNYPISYDLKFGSTSKAAGSIDGTTTYSASPSITGLAVGEYIVTLDLTDSKGAKRTIQVGSLTVSDGTRPPVVTLYASQLYVNACGGGSSNNVTLYGSAFDPDGDGLTALWSGTGVACSGNSSTNGYISSSCPVTVAGDTTYTYTVTDNSTPTPKSASRTVAVSTYSSAPWVSSLTAAPAVVFEGATVRDVTATAVARHSDGIDIVGHWTLDGSSVAACPDVTVASGASTTCTYTIPSTAAVGDSFTFRFTANACGKTGFRETAAKYGILPSAPTITNVGVPASVGLASAAVNLTATATDPNGDAITWSWSIVSGGGALGAGCSGSGATPVATSCSYTPPAMAASVALRFTASDGTLTNTADRTLSVSDGTNVVIQ